MKKKFCITLVALMIAMTAIAFAGCGGGGGDAAKEDEASSVGVIGDADSPTAIVPDAEEDQSATESDIAYVKGNGSLKIGITIFAPMNYYDDDGKLIGFDTEFAEAVCAKLGVKPEFIEINWDTKELELQSKNIDCIWNGFTVTPERAQEILFTDSYMKNMQVAVIRAKDADKYKTVEDMAKANIVAELGSAGEEAVISTGSGLETAPYTAMPKQTDALMEVKAGTADIAVLDYTAAKSMVGEGTNYSDLMMAPGIELNAEEYAVGFRLGSDIVPEANKAIAELTEDGTLDEIADKYELTASLISNQ
ncbi:MAG: transporter substrate-binding domain-containing protein [Clostridiales Family XIII bacterium]|nr:transporter substrate-binding domain-containing protein [Clostridiales Family XIII bacterium]